MNANICFFIIHILEYTVSFNSRVYNYYKILFHNLQYLHPGMVEFSTSCLNERQNAANIDHILAS